ncbi:hypothetical protein TRVL_08642 [Trypanosoma vivax]|nr:hypothetical protein TRVL_08642 [Trypanosoma vivax]
MPLRQHGASCESQCWNIARLPNQVSVSALIRCLFYTKWHVFCLSAQFRLRWPICVPEGKCFLCSMKHTARAEVRNVDVILTHNLGVLYYCYYKDAMVVYVWMLDRISCESFRTALLCSL